MAQPTTRNVFVSKSGVLHVQANTTPGQTPGLIYTWGTWTNGGLRGASRTLSPKNLAPAGTLTDNEGRFAYNPDAPHV